MTLPPCKPLHRGDTELIEFLLTPLHHDVSAHSDDEYEQRSPASRSLVTSERDWLTDCGDDEDIQMPYFEVDR